MVTRWIGLCGVCLVVVKLVSAQFNEAPVSTGFPTPVNTEPDGPVKALAPDEAARGFSVPEGFRVDVFAAEPHVQNPIAMAWDARGRLWIAENYTYADRSKKFDLSLRDRVLIFEDSDGDGTHDKRTVFTEDVQMLTGLVVGRGGLWLMTPPNLVFIPDHDEDDKPDGAPIVMLDGFTPSTDNYHTFANGLKWGPDGWLYGRCGASSPGRVGIPGASDSQRIPLNGGIWRFQPQTSVFEVLCHGTTNPWGMDWNEHGEAFFINTVNGHLWHVIPGGHFKRPHSEDPNPQVYELIDQHADHYHWDTGKDWTDSRKVTPEHDRRGGGHAHSGMSIYLGDNWPDAYRGKLLTLNLHGRRVNVEQLDRDGCGYVGRHQPDMLHAADPWFRGIDLSYGPDGAVYLLDWSDTGECHDSTGVHRTSGRIYRVSYQPTKGQGSRGSQGSGSDATGFDLRRRSLKELVQLHGHTNEWYVRTARQILVERFVDQKVRETEAARSQVVSELRQLFETNGDVVVKLRTLWTLFQLKSLGREELLKLARHENEHLRTWSVRLLVDDCPLDTIYGQLHPMAQKIRDDDFRELNRMAREDSSGLVRLALASSLQRLPIPRRIELATRLASRIEDADDHNLPLMVWYGLLPAASENTSSKNSTSSKTSNVEDAGSMMDRLPALARFAVECQFPTTRRLVSRRLAELVDDHPQGIEELLSSVKEEGVLNNILAGLMAGFAGRHKVKVPAAWEAVQKRADSSDDSMLRERVRDLSVLFGDGRALDDVKKIALDGKAEMSSRKAALRTLIESRPADLRDVCEKLLSVRSLNTVAVGGLASFDDASIGERLAKSYRSFYPQERSAVIETLVSRPSFSRSLLSEMSAGRIPRGDLSAFQARQIRSFGNEELTRQLMEAWGEFRDSPDDKRQLAQKLKSQLTAETLKVADRSAGRVVFNKLCANCHRLYGHGGQIGPDLTGAGRHNLDYVVDNLVDPSAVIGADYRMSVVVMKDGRVLNGIVSSKTNRSLGLQTAKERLTIELSEIEELQSSTLSLMPEGQLQPLSENEIRDLVGYLMHPTQVPLP